MVKTADPVTRGMVRQGIALHLMFRAACAVVLLSKACIAAPNAAIIESALRVEGWAAQESTQARVDSRLRAAQLLTSVAPDIAKQFEQDAIAELTKVRASRGMVMSLMALEPRRGEGLLLTTQDERTAYNLLVKYWATRSQPLRAATLLRQAVQHGLTGLTIDAAVFKAVVSVDPLQAVELWALLLANPKLVASPNAISQYAGTISQTFSSTARNQPEQTRAALRRLRILSQSEAFQRLPGRAGPYSVLLAGRPVQVAHSKELLRLRLGALEKMIDPEAYVRDQAQLSKWAEALATVKTLDHVTVEAIPEPPAPQTPFQFEAAMKNVHQQPTVKDKIRAAQEVMNRSDVSLDQKRAVALAVISAAEAVTDPGERNDLGSLLLDDDAIYLLGKPILERAVSLHLDGSNRSDQHPDNYAIMTQVIDSFGLNVGQGNPSIRARLELSHLGKLLSDTYDFSLPGLKGGRVDLRSYRGKAVLVNFWATWCGPCRTEMPILQKLHHELSAKGFTVLAVSDEDTETVQKFVEKFGYTFPVLLDAERHVFDHFRVMAIPATKIFNREGRLVAELENTTEPDLRQLLDKTLSTGN